MSKVALYFIVAALVIILGALAFYVRERPKDRIVSPALSDQEIEKFERFIRLTDEKILIDEKSRFAHLDKAEYQRQLGRIDEAIDTLENAYNINEDWRGLADFAYAEAKIYGSQSLSEGIRRYEDLISKYSFNEDYFRDYIRYLKNNNQPAEKIKSIYERAIKAIPDTLLERSYREYLEELEKLK